MLTSDKANALTRAINDAFDAIGVGPVTGMPRSKGNLEPLAWRWHVTSHLKRIAEAAQRKAGREAIVAGVIFDHEKKPLAQGTNALVYAGDVVEISVEVGTPAVRFDAAAFLVDVAAHVPPKVLAKLTELHTHENRAPHKFSSSLITSR